MKTLLSCFVMREQIIPSNLYYRYTNVMKCFSKPNFYLQLNHHGPYSVRVALKSNFAEIKSFFVNLQTKLHFQSHILSKTVSHTAKSNFKKVPGFRDRSEITRREGEGGRATIYVGRVIIFSNKILSGSLYFFT